MHLAHVHQLFVYCRWKKKNHHIKIFRDYKTNYFYIYRKKTFETVFVSLCFSFVIVYSCIHDCMNITFEN